MIYQPREDSYLLQKQIKKYCKPGYIVLDVGTGSAILAKEAAKYCKKVVAVDIQKSVIDELKRQKQSAENKIFKKITYRVSDLFSNVGGKYDLIIFNPPYLPEDVRLKDITVEGGKKGYEIIERFLSEIHDYLKPNGKILLLFSSLTNKNKINEFIEKYGLKFEQAANKKIFFEELFVYLIEKISLVKELEKKRIKNIELFSRGKRGLIYRGNVGKKKIAIKIKNPKSKAVGRIKNEIKFLKILNKHGIGQKLLFSTKNYFVYQFAEGLFIKQFLEQEKNKNKIKEVLENVFLQCYKLDKLGINKEEMHNPYKHIVIGKKITLIDFERACFSKKPHNVTQFIQYVLRNKKLLEGKGFKIDRDKFIKLGREYKKNRNKKNFNQIVGLVL